MQRRNVDNFQVAAISRRSGKLGKLHTLHAGIWLPKAGRPDLPGQPEPAPKSSIGTAGSARPRIRPYNQTYVRGQWRHYDGFSAGWGLHDWASHTVNLCQWAVDADDTAPVEYWTENDQLCARYANGVKLVMRLAGFNNEGDWLGLGSCPVRFEGDAGWVEAGDNGQLALSDPSLLEPVPCPPKCRASIRSKHIREFLDCVKSRGKPPATPRSPATAKSPAMRRPSVGNSAASCSLITAKNASSMPRMPTRSAPVPRRAPFQFHAWPRLPDPLLLPYRGADFRLGNALQPEHCGARTCRRNRASQVPP
jgi:hypothetical protein